ncbi:SRPBCC family protein [Nonomuraea ferruginea]|uniref:SRPBCC domain-containing protein n=1 Tax=Nonomuraea ferruginea TaxID=46174 RepID=A0ABT4T2W7_9ACTN|nr:SRPBCC domain-containing protein [Nonomuraea ferruginea]MDA0643827.1 SRPBCC domain-containing protein [Nonomuraea ferruginea]
MTDDPRAIRLDEFVPYPPDRVWRAFVEPRLVTKWLGPEDFQPVVGHRFTIVTQAVPTTKFDGVIHCQVLAIEPERMLRISWDDHGPSGARCTATWRLVAEGHGTRLFFDHEGFDPDDELQQRARRIMGGGWRSWLFSRLETVLADDTAGRDATGEGLPYRPA